MNRSRRGNVILEFAMALMVLCPLLLGVFDFGRAFFLYSRLEDGVRAAARYGSLRPFDGDRNAWEAAVRNAAVEALPGIGEESIGVKLGFEAGVPRWVTVQVKSFRLGTFRLLNVQNKPTVVSPYLGRYAAPK